MKQLTAVAILLAAIHLNTTNTFTASKLLPQDTTTWRLVLLKGVSANGKESATMDYANTEPQMYLCYISGTQLVFVVKAFKQDTASFKRIRDTLLIYGFKLFAGKGIDTLLVQMQSKDSLVLQRQSHTGLTTFHFTSKPYEKYRPQVAANFFKSDNVWKLISSESNWRSIDGQKTSSSQMSMVEGANKNTEIFLHLANDTLAATISKTGNFTDTSYSHRRGNTLVSTGARPEILVIETLSEDSLVVVGEKKDTRGTTIRTLRYGKVKTGE